MFFGLAGVIMTVRKGIATVDVPGRNVAYTAPQGIDDRGDIVGFWGDTDGVDHFYRQHDGVVTNLDLPGAPRGVNARGDIVGEIDLPDRPEGFLAAKDGTVTLLDYPGVAGTITFGINAPGEIVGLWFEPGFNTDHGFLYRPGNGGGAGAWQSFDDPGSLCTEAYGINDEGDIVGAYCDQDFRPHGFLLHEGAFSLVEPPGSRSSEAHGINARGVFVGNYDTVDGATHGFLVAPQARRPTQPAAGMATRTPQSTFSRGRTENRRAAGGLRHAKPDRVSGPGPLPGALKLILPP